MSAAATRIRLLGLRVPDPAALGAYHREVLGLAVHEVPHGVEVVAGATRIVLLEGGRPAPVHFAFNVPVGSLDAVAEVLERHGPLLADAGGTTRFEFARWRARAVYARDPAGNLLEWIERERLGEGGGTPLGPTHVLGVSEIGVVVPDVAAFARAAGDAVPLPPFGSPGDDFAALGDDRGLLIAVREGRPWYPENREPAVPVRTYVEWEGAGPGGFDWPAGPFRLRAPSD